MHDERRIASILETTGQPRHEADGPVGLPQQQRARIRRDRAAIERAHDIAALDGSRTNPGIHSVGFGVALAPP